MAAAINDERVALGYIICRCFALLARSRWFVKTFQSAVRL